MKQVEVSILGQTYMLGCPDGAETLLRGAVAAVDHEMTVIRNAGKVKARERVAVLAALNLAFQLAERGAQGSAAGSAAARLLPPAGSGPAAPTAPAGLGAGRAAEATATVAELVRRIDAALEEDGQLL